MNSERMIMESLNREEFIEKLVSDYKLRKEDLEKLSDEELFRIPELLYKFNMGIDEDFSILRKAGFDLTPIHLNLINTLDKPVEIGRITINPSSLRINIIREISPRYIDRKNGYLIYIERKRVEVKGIDDVLDEVSNGDIFVIIVKEYDPEIRKYVDRKIMERFKDVIAIKYAKLLNMKIFKKRIRADGLILID